MQKNNNELPVISVIMGVYNIEKLNMFQKAIDSILNQTYKNFEFIICDDGSTDSTWQILKKLTQKDSRIILLRNGNNKGLAASLNHCLYYAKGQFIARQDADDISNIERFQKQINYLNNNKEIDFVGSNVILWDENGEFGKRVFPNKPTKKDFLFTMPFVHGALMFRKKTLFDVGCYRIAKETRRTEDYDLLMRIYSKEKKGANIQDILYYFCENQAATYRRKYRYRIDEAKIRWKGFSALGLMPLGFIFILKPLIVGLIPFQFLRNIKRFVFNNKIKTY